MAAEQRFSVPRWVFALIVGLPVTAGVFYLIRKKYHDQNLPEVKGTCKSEKKKSLAEKIDNSVKKKENNSVGNHLDEALKLKNAGNTFYKNGDYREAIRCYTEAISICPIEERGDVAMLYQNRAAAYELLNDTENVLKDCGDAISFKPDYLKALTRRYKAAEKLGHLRQALEDVTAVCLLEKFNSMDSLAAADRILKSIGQIEGQKYMKTRCYNFPSAYFMKAYFASFTQDPVLKDLSSLASAEPSLLRAVDRGRLALLKEKYEEIIPACEEEIKNPSSVEATELALLLRASMRILTCHPEAIIDLNLLIESTKDPRIKANALLRRGCLHMQTEESDKCFEDFSEAASIDPSNPDVPHQRAQMFLLGERLEDAVTEFHKASKLNPSSGLVQVQKLYAEYRLGMMREDPQMTSSAKAGLQEATSKFPSTPEGYMLLAQVYSDSQEYEKAEATFDKGIQADGKNASILVHKGLLYLQWKGDINTAKDLIEKALEVDPKCEFAYETLASIEVQRGNFSRAVTLFDKAIPLAKSEREACHILSLKAAAQAQIVVAQSLGLDPLAA